MNLLQVQIAGLQHFGSQARLSSLLLISNVPVNFLQAVLPNQPGYVSKPYEMLWRLEKLDTVRLTSQQQRPLGL